MIAATSLRYRTAVRDWLQSHSQLVFGVGLSVIILFGITLASARIGRSLTIDEPLTANQIYGSPLHVFTYFWQESIRPVYFMLAKVWTQIFGESEIALRSLSVLFFSLTVLTVGVTARRVAGMQAGLIAAMLFASSIDMGLMHATNARPYALLGLQAAIAALICLHLMQLAPTVDTRQTRSVVTRREGALLGLLIVLNVVGLLTHTIFAFVICACSCAAIFASRRMFLLLGVCSALSVAIFLAFRVHILFGVLEKPSLDWMPSPDLSDLQNAILSLWGTKKSLLLLAYVAGVVLVRWHRSAQVLTSKLVLVSISMAAVACLLPFAVTPLKVVFNPERTPITFLPLVCVTLAILISRLGWKPLTVLVVGMIALSSARAAAQISIAPDPAPARTSVQYVVSQARCGDTFVLGGVSYSEVTYYMRRFNAPDCIRTETIPLDTASHPGWIDVQGLLSQPEKIEAQAAETAMRLAGQPGNVWLFYNGPDGSVSSGLGHEVTAIFKHQLDQRMTVVQDLDLSGSFFNTVFIYTAQSE